jgi:hypothetical protein
MAVIRRQVNQIIEECALAAEQGGPAAVRGLKIPEGDELPPRVPPQYAMAGVTPMKADDHDGKDHHL